jgi:hypothetical protein
MQMLGGAHFYLDQARSGVSACFTSHYKQESSKDFLISQWASVALYWAIRGFVLDVPIVHLHVRVHRAFASLHRTSAMAVAQDTFQSSRCGICGVCAAENFCRVWADCPIILSTHAWSSCMCWSVMRGSVTQLRGADLFDVHAWTSN